MKKRVLVTDSEIQNSELILKTNEAIDGLSPRGQMLVDSDQLSFVYLMEEGDEYVYILLPESVWADMKKGYDESLPVFLQAKESRIGLTGFNDELGYLAENIKGNSNYGETMAAKVETIFY
ncbi:hypothetical protein [Bacillus sp. B-jedd]|uniref:UPF0738 family protein n=1 Tax=Bacillus sp. B-jedd TaxID=1476857 RepID=UPI0005156DE7|nr:hypothetical protein [Bacillus sp. B-jedd]CEG26120.1 phosphatase [Bacillus sp. B-jedd]